MSFLRRRQRLPGRGLGRAMGLYQGSAVAPTCWVRLSEVWHLAPGVGGIAGRLEMRAVAARLSKGQGREGVLMQ